MNKTMVSPVLAVLMVLSLAIAACGPAAATSPTIPPTPATQPLSASPAVPQAPTPIQEVPKQETPTAAATTPKNGGTLVLALTADVVDFDTIVKTSDSYPTQSIVNEELWGGDWTKGTAGGYGSKETDWGGNANLWHLNAGVVAESTKWTIDEANNQGTVVYEIRRGLHYALNQNSEASRLVAGRELTADDVISHVKRVITDKTAYIYTSTPGLRTANVTKTGDWEVTVKVSLADLISAIDRFGDSMQLVPPEVVQKYGGQTNWQKVVGTGPFMLTDYVAGSTVIFNKNPNYWMKDPIGPGAGNQLPYLDRVQYLIIPDASTQLAALRTGKIDVLNKLTMEDAAQMRKTARGTLLEKEVQGQLMTSVSMRTDTAPFSDLRVRRAMLMAIDFQGLYQSVAQGKGRMLRRPVDPVVKGYEPLMVEFDDPDKPADVKENFSYNPGKAAQLLKDAGYPQGFKTQALMTTAEVDSWSIYKDYWAKIGVDVEFMIRDTAAYSSIVNSRQHPALISAPGYNPAIFYAQTAFTGSGSTNRSIINDPFINDIEEQARLVAIREGLPAAMKLAKKMTIYVLQQAYEIPGIDGAAYRMWWPWLKGYSGETSVGYGNQFWPKFVWVDQELKNSMGH